MRKKWWILLAILVFWFGGYALVNDGKKYCRDGTITYSTGRGTCSWHKGQGMQPEKKPILFISLILLLAWGWYFFLYDRESTISHNINQNVDYSNYFRGYSPETPKEVIIQLVMRINDPQNDSLIDAICKSFKIEHEKALDIINEAIRRKKIPNTL